MPLIKVTAIIDTRDLSADEIDFSDPTGLSETAHIHFSSGSAVLPLQDIDFQLQQDWK